MVASFLKYYYAFYNWLGTDTCIFTLENRKIKKPVRLEKLLLNVKLSLEQMQFGNRISIRFVFISLMYLCR